MIVTASAEFTLIVEILYEKRPILNKRTVELNLQKNVE